MTRFGAVADGGVALRGAVVHPTAIVDPAARLGEGVRIGPWCQVGPDAVLGEGVSLHSHVVIDGRTTIGAGTTIYPFVTIGLPPQDLKYAGEPTACVIGARCTIREHVTIHRGTEGGGGVTRVGDDCLLMAVVHVAHDCAIGDRVILVNNVVLGGHVRIDDHARVMGSAAVHQFVRIGRAAMVGGVCGVEADVIPYGSVIGNRARLVGLHWIWLRRNGVCTADIRRLRQAFRTLYPRGSEEAGVFTERLAAMRDAFGDDPRVAEILAFIDAPSRRGLVRPARMQAEDEQDGV